MQRFALPHGENIGSAPFQRAPGLTVAGMSTIRDLSVKDPAVQGQVKTILPNRLHHTPIRQTSDYTSIETLPPASYSLHRSKDAGIPTQQEDWSLKHQTSSAIDNTMWDTQSLTRDEFMTNFHGSRVINKNGRLVYVKQSTVQPGIETYNGDVWQQREHDVGLAPFQNDYQYILTTPGLGRSDAWQAPALEGWGWNPLTEPPAFSLPTYYPYRPHAPTNSGYVYPLPLQAQLEQHIKMHPERRDLGKGFINKTFRGRPVITYDGWAHAQSQGDNDPSQEERASVAGVPILRPERAYGRNLKMLRKKGKFSLK